MVDKIKHIFIVLVLPTKSSLNIKKHAVHYIHRLAWGTYGRRARATAQCVHALRRHWHKGVKCDRQKYNYQPLKPLFYTFTVCDQYFVNITWNV